MDKVSLAYLLKSNTYPGRGIVLGMTSDSKNVAIGYFIMGRSVNSRNRIFVSQPDGGIITRAFDEDKLSDPSLIIYAPIRKPSEDTWVVTNGDQTDTICDFLKKGLTFEDALRTRTFEPDAPNWTPRISGIVILGDESASYRLSILKSNNMNGESLERHFWEYPQPLCGEGRFLHTYRCDGNPIPSFEGEPERVAIVSDFDTFTDEIWSNLNEDNKVSLFTAFVDVKSRKVVRSAIINKNA